MVPFQGMFAENQWLESIYFLVKSPLLRGHVSNEKNLACLGYIGDYATQLYRDHNKLS